MARHPKNGFSYFPLDTDVFEDDKVQLMSSEFGIKGEVIYLRLLCKIYRNGYFYAWGNDEALLLAKSVGNGVTGALVSEVVQGCIRRSLFNKRVFDTFQILTSVGIQKRYGQICGMLKRPATIDPRYDCISFAAHKKDIQEKQSDFQENDPVIPEKDAQRKRKEKKEKEMRGKSVLDEVWIEQTCMAYRTERDTILKFCEEWILKAIAKQKFDQYEPNQLITYMLIDFEKEKNIAQKNEKGGKNGFSENRNGLEELRQSSMESLIGGADS